MNENGFNNTRATIKDVAVKANVSLSTVSRALSGSKELSEATRERIVKICNEQGYRVNALARSLIRSRTNVIGLIVPEVTNPFYAEVSLGIETHARQLGYNVMLCNSQQDAKTTEELFGKVDDWMRNFERDMDADRSRIQRLKEKVLTPGELYMIIGMLTALRVSHDSADKRLASQVDTYPLNQGQISVFTEELLKLSLEQPRITAWDVYNVATEIYKPGKTDFPAMIPQNGAMADFLLSYNQN